MTEVEIMRDVGLAIILAYILMQMVNLLKRLATGNRASESALTAIIDKLLTSMVDRFGELMLKVQTNNEALVKQMIESQATSNSEMIKQVSEHMAPSIARRDQKADLIHTDVKTVPAETQRLLQLDLAQQTENIRLAIEQTLVETERRIVTNLSQAGEAQLAVHEALNVMKTDLSSAMKQLKMIHETLDRLEKAAKNTEPGEAKEVTPEPSEEKTGKEPTA